MVTTDKTVSERYGLTSRIASVAINRQGNESEMSTNSESTSDEAVSRELPAHISIPEIRGEMLRLRPATLNDLSALDELESFYNASKITGKDEQSERAVVHAWVHRSVAWMNGIASSESGVGDPEARRTIAWSILAKPQKDEDETTDAVQDECVIGMIFLIDIDGWARSARIQVILGKDYRGRGYSRDAMPRVMTYGFASRPSGLGMHRIWVSVPEKNTRSLSVYQSLGFVRSGTSRDALWDAENHKYQDLNVLDTLADEYDPIRSLDAFGMHVIEDNPGVQEALSAREHSIAIRQQALSGDGDSSSVAFADPGSSTDTNVDRMTQDKAKKNVAQFEATDNTSGDGTVADDPDDNMFIPLALDDTDGEEFNAIARDAQQQTNGGNRLSQSGADPDDETTEDSNWPFNSQERKSSKQAWWRNLGRGHRNDKEDNR
jgi:RimJ/RimL family protein N-acetyltransferase